MLVEKSKIPGEVTFQMNIPELRELVDQFESQAKELRKTLDAIEKFEGRIIPKVRSV